MKDKLAKHDEKILGYTFASGIKIPLPDIPALSSRGYRAGDIIPAGKYTVEQLAEIIRKEFKYGIEQVSNYFYLHLTGTTPTINPQAYPTVQSALTELNKNTAGGNIRIGGTVFGNHGSISIFPGETVHLESIVNDEYRFINWQTYQWPNKDSEGYSDHADLYYTVPEDYADNNIIHVVECQWLKNPVKATSIPLATDGKPVCLFKAYEHGTDNLIGTFTDEEIAVGKFERGVPIDIEPVVKDDQPYVFEEWSDGVTELRRTVTPDLDIVDKVFKAKFKDNFATIMLITLPYESKLAGEEWIVTDPAEWSDNHTITKRVVVPESGTYHIKVTDLQTHSLFRVSAVDINGELYPVDSNGVVDVTFPIENGGHYSAEVHTTTVRSTYEVTVSDWWDCTVTPTPGITYTNYYPRSQDEFFDVRCEINPGYRLEAAILYTYNRHTKTWDESILSGGGYLTEYTISFGYHPYAIVDVEPGGQYRLKFDVRPIYQPTSYIDAVWEPDEAASNIEGRGSYHDGDTAVLKIILNEGYKLIKWSDSTMSNPHGENPRTVLVDGSATYTALIGKEYATTLDIECPDDLFFDIQMRDSNYAVPIELVENVTNGMTVMLKGTAYVYETHRGGGRMTLLNIPADYTWQVWVSTSTNPDGSRHWTSWSADEPSCNYHSDIDHYVYKLVVAKK